MMGREGSDMKLWSFELRITRRDRFLSEIDEELDKVGIKTTGVEGVRDLAEYFRRADRFARGAARRVSELEASVVEYERALRGLQAVEQQAVARRQEEATPIEAAARRSSGVDLPLTQRSPVWRTGSTDHIQQIDTRARPIPVYEDTSKTVDLSKPVPQPSE
jgi:hypothetical protein